LGVDQPPSLPFNLNSAVDHLLKKEFDVHRANGKPHPLMEAYGLDAIPLRHKSLNTWRENFEGVQYLHEPTNFLVTGAVDDIWINPKGEFIVVDYKSTSKDDEVNIDAEWQMGYKRQMEIYQWLLRKNGHKVSDTGFFVYCNARRDSKAFDGKLEFSIKLIPYKGDDSWIDSALIKAKKCLTALTIPKPSADCDYCKYRAAAAEKE
jgi:RecB family exonuclease